MRGALPGLALALLVSAAPAQADVELARAKACLGCHDIERCKVGPSFKEIAARYRNHPGVTEVLARKVLEGGKGAWGEVPMPANQGRVTPAEARRLVAWVLAQK